MTSLRLNPSKFQFATPKWKDRRPERLVEQVGFGNNLGALRMFQYLPDAGTGLPLVVILHGCGQTAEEYNEGTGWTDLAAKLGIAVLAPEQSRANNLNGCFNWFQATDNRRGMGEAESIHEMIEWMIQHNAIDRSRIYVTGLSAGGAMAAVMLAAYSDVFASGAIIAGLPIGAASNVPEALHLMRHAPEKTAGEWGGYVRESSSHQGPWPTISIWHGDADQTVHSSNGEASVAQWADVHRVAIAESRTESFGSHLRTSWRNTKGAVVLEAFRLRNMGHGAPVGGPYPQRYGEQGKYFLDVGISSTVHIAAFWGFPILPIEDRETGHTSTEKPSWYVLPKTVRFTISDALRSVGLM